VLAQQVIQPSVEGWLAAVGKSVVGTHIAGCRSRFRLPIDIDEL
jgi:hypothetical protein